MTEYLTKHRTAISKLLTNANHQSNNYSIVKI